MVSNEDRVARYRRLLPRYGQEHLLGFWDELSEAQRAALLDDLDRVDFERLAGLIAAPATGEPVVADPASIEPVEFLPARPGLEQVGWYAEAVRRGIRLIRAGRVAALTVAGGQGTRLGFDGPKGAFPISPVRGKSLFQLFAEFLRGTMGRYGGRLAWYIMTSPANHAETVAFFERNGFFGLDRCDVVFFRQGVMPAISRDGKILLDQKHRLAFAPDGHGGSLFALAASGALDDMARRGVEYISYFQVDNPLVKPVDPLFVGLHEQTGSEMSSKTIPKADDFEKVGCFVRMGGRTCVIEYSDLPAELATARNPDGSRKFNAGSIAIHVLSRRFVERVVQDGDAHTLLAWHRAEKKVPYVDPATGRRIEPDRPNAIKFERFVFDAIRGARSPMILETIRSEEFSPVKNATGPDSIATARRDMSLRAARWLERCGTAIPRRPDGQPDGVFEISPLFAVDAEHLQERLECPPQVRPGARVYIE